MQPIDQLLKTYDLERHKSSIIASFQSSIKMKKIQQNDNDIPLGSSKIGGSPDLPEEWEFPRNKESNLTFMLQVNLKDAKQFDKNNVLPDIGILYLFYDVEEQPWGFEDEEGCFTVLYYNGDFSKLKRKDNPIKGEFSSLPSFNIAFESMVSIPEYLEDINFLNEEEEENYWEFRQALMQPEDENGIMESAHYMLGAPMNIQNDVFEELFEDGEDPVLLFQIDSDEEELGLMWGDSGMLYFCMEKEDLLKKQFDRVAFTLQCY
ncbi:YwqG family protein [Sutcliffiella rhizosphaerae]|uniref:DUF1963 domain-containing protein n=1 Tax=Sutcliffiella rhizosphaerae TaxID=2880967 RepID=A0ABN8AAB0_9BACI|nr:YwqG family protein [Sutcliffiella rhizosphaerae]CAG9620362.1 hypothetical protein BACCIP111883_01130 [Sutcliffiella rhizosphaerae]